MKRRTMMAAMTLWIGLAVGALAADIKNYSNCDVCPANLHFGPDETRELLGKEGKGLAKLLVEKPETYLFLDLDGTRNAFMSQTVGPTPEGYDLKISWRGPVFYITSLKDDSFVLVLPDLPGAAADSLIAGDWNPEMYLQPPHEHDVTMSKDTVPAIWERLRASHIYEWGAGLDTPPDKAAEKIAKKINGILRMLAEVK